MKRSVRSRPLSMPGPSCKLEFKVIPNAPRTCLAGRLGSAFKVRVHAPALEGRANDELCAWLSECLGLPRRAVGIATGETSRKKLIRISGLTREQAEAGLERLATGQTGAGGQPGTQCIVSQLACQKPERFWPWARRDGKGYPQRGYSSPEQRSSGAKAPG